jgi:hypothetical protein
VEIEIDNLEKQHKTHAINKYIKWYLNGKKRWSKDEFRCIAQEYNECCEDTKTKMLEWYYNLPYGEDLIIFSICFVGLFYADNCILVENICQEAEEQAMEKMNSSATKIQQWIKEIIIAILK